MADFAPPPMTRDQLVLFPEKLDNIVPQNAPVRLFDAILNRLDWNEWESAYQLVRGQPPIHPKVIAGVILYGILKGIRSSRALEEAILFRIDFHWLVHGRSIDHTTISKFRTKHAALIKDLYVKIALIARETGDLTLDALGFDGTKIRANNRRSRVRTPEELRKAKLELGAKYEELNAAIAKQDEEENKRFEDANLANLNKDLADVKQNIKKVDAALAELKRLEDEKQTIPTQLPIIDPESRMTPNKEGGFAPNYTPIATVDINSGLIVGACVIATTEEDKAMIPSVIEVMDSFGLDKPPPTLLADGMMSTGENLAACQSMGIDLYSPIKLDNVENNPAIRADLSKPVANEDIGRLPVITTTLKDGTKTTQFDKNAFVYNEETGSYWCPAGQELRFSKRSQETNRGRVRVRTRYSAAPSVCAACQLRAKCIQGSAKSRTINREQHEELRKAHAKKMSREESKKTYEKRRSPGERPFAIIKSHFGARRFLTRGLEKVTAEWGWLVSAFNFQCIMRILKRKTGPPAAEPQASCSSP